MEHLRHCPDGGRAQIGASAAARRALLATGATLAVLVVALGGCDASTAVTLSTPALYINEIHGPERCHHRGYGRQRRLSGLDRDLQRRGNQR